MPCNRQNNAPSLLPPKDLHVVVPGTFEYVVTWRKGINVGDGLQVANLFDPKVGVLSWII